MLSISGAICLPAFFEDRFAPASVAMQQLAEVTASPSLALIQKCADALEGLRLLEVPILHDAD